MSDGLRGTYTSKFLVRDRDYLLDTDGNYLRILGDYHPKGTIVSYVKYFPSVLGGRKIEEQMYGYNTFVSKSFNILKGQEDRVILSDRHGGVITATPVHKIKQYFSCRRKLAQILEEKQRYLDQTVGKHLITFLEQIHNTVNLADVGITGSFLINAQNDKSDIDLVCYGREAYEALKVFFKESSFIQRYEGELANALYARRMIHMTSIDFDTLIRQEARKLQGVIRGTDIHINCQPLRADGDEFMDIRFLELSTVSCVVWITEDSQGIFSPAYYSVHVESVVNSLFHDDTLADQITAMISFSGDFSQVFHKGDRVYLEGKLVRVSRGDEQSLAVELSSFNTNKIYKAVLLT